MSTSNNGVTIEASSAAYENFAISNGLGCLNWIFCIDFGTFHATREKMSKWNPFVGFFVSAYITFFFPIHWFSYLFLFHDDRNTTHEFSFRGISSFVSRLCWSSNISWFCISQTFPFFLSSEVPNLCFLSSTQVVIFLWLKRSLIQASKPELYINFLSILLILQVC